MSGGRKPRKCTINGVEYPSINAAARELGVYANSIRQSVEKGYTIGGNVAKRQPCRLEGEWFPTIAAAEIWSGAKRTALYHVAYQLRKNGQRARQTRYGFLELLERKDEK